jgi:hypothetical protein
MWTIRQADIQSAVNLAKHLREDDLNELEASVGDPPEYILQNAVELSEGRSWIAAYNNEDILIWGVVALETLGVPWMMATPRIKELSFSFVKGCRPYLDQLMDGFVELRNFVDARNTLHIRWLKWLGFNFIQLHPEWGVGRLPFWEFVKRK